MAHDTGRGGGGSQEAEKAGSGKTSLRDQCFCTKLLAWSGAAPGDIEEEAA